MLKTKTIKTDKATLFVVELPNGKYVRCHKGYIVQSCSTELDLINKCKRIDNGDTNGFIHIGNWQLLGRLPDITEIQASEAVEFKNIKSEYQCDCCGYDVDCYRNYVDQDENAWIDNPVADRAHNATDSFSSLLQANEIYFENPLGKGDEFTRPWGYRQTWPEWQEAQSKVWDKERCYLFIKVD